MHAHPPTSWRMKKKRADSTDVRCVYLRCKQFLAHIKSKQSAITTPLHTRMLVRKRKVSVVGGEGGRKHIASIRRRSTFRL